MAHAPAARAQQGDSLEAINADHLRELDALEKKRLQRLEKLAADLKGVARNDALVAYFQTALSASMYAEAEALAESLLKQEKLDNRVLFLAEITNILAEIDRGAYDDSLQSLAAAIRASRQAEEDRQPLGLVLPQHTRLSILQAVYQKLVQAGQFDVARKALTMLVDQAGDPAIRSYASDHLAHLALLGQPAPAIVGLDLDGKAFDLGALAGQPVLVVFWASWCLPCGPEAEMLDQLLADYKSKGLQVVGINVDGLQVDAGTPEQIAADVRRFVVEHNVRFPILINGTGAADYARAYTVSELPANFLIGRDGRVVQIDLTIANIDAAIQKTLAQ
jgi:thiol-disulfide isomerase/thioredoxin